MMPQATENPRGHWGKSEANQKKQPDYCAGLSWKHLGTGRRCDPLALCAEMSNPKRSGLVFSILQFHCFLSWQLHNWECREIKSRRKEIRAGKCQVDLLQRWGAGVPGKSNFLPEPLSPASPAIENSCFAHSWSSPETPVCLDCDLAYIHSVQGLFCSRFNEQNPWKGADILMPPIDTLHWDNKLCTAFKALANPNAPKS